MIGPKKLEKPPRTRHKYELTGLSPIDQFGIRQANAETKNGAADGAKSGGDDERCKAKTMHVHAEIFSLASIVANGLKVQSKRRMHDSPHQETGDHQQTKAIIVKRTGEKLDLIVALERQAPGYSCAARACRCRRR